jgi:hypothetical protein
VAQHAMQVYYLPWACQKDPNLMGWYLVQLVLPHGKLPAPNNEDYNFDPDTREFYQPEGLEGRFDIDMFALMEVDNDIDQADGDDDEGEEVEDEQDLQILEQVLLGNDNDRTMEMRTREERCNMTISKVMTTSMIQPLPIVKNISNSCNTILFLLLLLLQLCFIHFVSLYKYLQLII